MERGDASTLTHTLGLLRCYRIGYGADAAFTEMAPWPCTMELYTENDTVGSSCCACSELGSWKDRANTARFRGYHTTPVTSSDLRDDATRRPRSRSRRTRRFSKFTAEKDAFGRAPCTRPQQMSREASPSKSRDRCREKWWRGGFGREPSTVRQCHAARTLLLFDKRDVEMPDPKSAIGAMFRASRYRR